jgi:predicted dehydrogenase
VLKQLNENPNAVLFIDEIHTLIGAGAHVIGDVISAESVELSGQVTGRLVSGNGGKNGTVLIKAKGSLQGQLVGDAVTILGHVQGTVRSAGVLQLGADAKAATRLPMGHPEGYLEAFANLYRDFAALLRGTGTAALVPGAEDGLRGMTLIATAVNSSRAGGGWTPLTI